MESVPRFMPWHRKLADTVVAEWQQALQSPAFAEAWHEACAAFRAVMTHAQHRPFPLSDEESEQLWQDASPAILAYRDSSQRFMAFLPRYVPQLVAVYGRHVDELLYGVLLHQCHITPPPGVGERVERLAPDNPLRLTPEGTLAGWQEATEVDLMALKLYKASVRPTRKRGRKKAAMPKHGPSQSRLDPGLATEAYHMAEDHQPWQLIARKLLPQLNLHDRRQAEQARKKVARLIERGRLLQSHSQK